jgi:hypothetical protein
MTETHFMPTTKSTTVATRVAIATPLACLALAGTSFAGTITVPGDQPTIQAGIDAAFDGDEVILADGVYTGTGNLDLRFDGRAITVRSANGPAACTIDVDNGNQPSVGFIFDAGEGRSARIEGIRFFHSGTPGSDRGLLITDASPTIVNCRFESIAGYGSGGAVEVAGGSPLFQSCTFEECIAETGGAVSQSDGASVFESCTFSSCRAAAFCTGLGGAITSSGGTLSILGCVFEANEAQNDSSSSTCEAVGEGRGGAIHAIDTIVELRDSAFLSNRAIGDAAITRARGGAIALDGCTGEISGCTFTSNVADPDGKVEQIAHGGALWIAGSSVNVRDCSFANNTTSASAQFFTTGESHGGAVWMGAPVDGPSAGLPSDGVFMNCRFEGNDTCGGFCPPGMDANSGQAGGALVVTSDGSASFVNCQFSGNAATEHGGAMLVAGAIELVHCTVADNADPDGAVHTEAGGTSTVRNSIVRTSQLAAFVGAGTVDAQTNIVTGPVPCGGCIDNFDVDPGFADAGSGDYRLAEGSPAVDRGDLAFLPADSLDLDDDGDTREPLPVDLDGVTRVVDQPKVAGEVDLGAYERQGPTVGPCPADLDGDGEVGFTDLTALLAAWGPCGEEPCPADLNGGGFVGFPDLTALLAAWGACE